MKQYWTNAITYKPDIDESDDWNKEHQLSERVAIWMEGDDMARFGRCNHFIDKWSVEGYTGFQQERIKWFQYITNPYN